MCDKAVKGDPYSLLYVPDWFVARGPIDIWYDDKHWYHDDKLIEWDEGYKKRKAQKASIKEYLLPSIHQDIGKMKDEKRDTEKLWA